MCIEGFIFTAILLCFGDDLASRISHEKRRDVIDVWSEIVFEFDAGVADLTTAVRGDAELRSCGGRIVVVKIREIERPAFNLIVSQSPATLSAKFHPPYERATM
ncbi:hypothetical protein BKA61DRAFT_736707 [Leptodontidium sp. MPI-SDFR-AT-0119]|nr:hypothetical protein BKA61DRAFT_736707 [Leptodontidium sp. MPI-SDFR-AT-0119]